MKRFFDNINNVEYVINNKKYIIKDIFDLYKNYENISKYISNNKYFYIIKIADGDKWETLALKYYGNMEYMWVLQILNEFDDIFYNFALTHEELINATHYNLDNSNITQVLFDAAIDENDQKRYLKILKKEYLNEFEYEVFGTIV